jgi:hypothetical protein
MRIVEVPINWYYANRSQVRPIQDTYNMFREVLKVRLNDWQGRYRAPARNSNQPSKRQSRQIGKL